MSENPVGTAASSSSEYATSGAKVVVDGVGKVFGDRANKVSALEDISLTVGDGEFVAIVGPSGCGKSTLLRLIAGLQEATVGTIKIDKSDPDRPSNAMVFQDDALFPWRTVRRNVTFGPENRGKLDDTVLASADEHLAQLGLEGFGDFYPHQLSGGMKQRVGIARALVQDPEILLMDEPLGALDAQTRTVIQDQILALHQATKKTVIYVTHAIDEAVFLANRVLLMTSRPGRIKEAIKVELPEPRSPEVRGSPEFARLSHEIWEHLRSEVMLASKQEHPSD